MSASGDGVHSRSEIASVASRLISSGIRLSRLRSPASRCMTGIQSLVPTMAQATVALTSPTTTIASGRSRMRGLRKAQIAEESIRHVGVVVLSSVHDVR